MQFPVQFDNDTRVIKILFQPRGWNRNVIHIHFRIYFTSLIVGFIHSHCSC